MLRSGMLAGAKQRRTDVKKPMKSHKEPDKDQKGGKSDKDADDRRKPPTLKGVKKGK